MAALEREQGRVPVIGWEEIWAEHLDWKPGQHISYIGPTGVGKTTATVSLLEQTPQHAILIVTKNRDSLVRRLPTERGWRLARDPEQAFRLMKRKTGDWLERRERPPQRIVYWPETGKGVSLARRAELLSWRVEAILDRAYDRGSVTVAIDETTFASEELGLRRPLVLFWNEGRSSRISIVAGMQRPALVPRSARSAPTYLGIFRTADPDDLKAVAEMAGQAERRALRDEIAALPEHHHLLVNTRTGDMFVTRVVIRKRRGKGQE
jgi:hypothetical protein